MTPRERVFAALQHRVPDRVPRCELWIDALLQALGEPDPAAVYAHVGQDAVMLPSQLPSGSNAWRTGVDEFGRVWRDGIYAGGVVDTAADLARYTPPLDDADGFFDAVRASEVRATFPDHALIYGTHIGPFTAAYMAMGFERFFIRLVDDPAFVQRLLAARTEWAIAMYRRAVALGAEVLVLGDDAGGSGGPMIPPAMWRAMVLPLHRQIVEAVDVPMLWHSDGNIEMLLPTAIEAGFVGIHGLDPIAGMDLARIKRAYGRDLVLVGNVDVRVLCGEDLSAVRREVDRCLAQGAPGGGYMLATCNSIFAGMNAAAVRELFRYAASAAPVT